jgi:hypothetical protein
MPPTYIGLVRFESVNVPSDACPIPLLSWPPYVMNFKTPEEALLGTGRQLVAIVTTSVDDRAKADPPFWTGYGRPVSNEGLNMHADRFHSILGQEFISIAPDARVIRLGNIYSISEGMVSFWMLLFCVSCVMASHQSPASPGEGHVLGILMVVIPPD